MYRFVLQPGLSRLRSRVLTLVAGAHRLFGRAVQVLSLLHPARTALPAWLPRPKPAALAGVLAFMLIADAHPATDTATPLIFGVFPSMTAKQTLELYQPLARLMEKHLRRRVVIYSARDFKTFAERNKPLSPPTPTSAASAPATTNFPPIDGAGEAR